MVSFLYGAELQPHAMQPHAIDSRAESREQAEGAALVNLVLIKI